MTILSKLNAHTVRYKPYLSFSLRLIHLNSQLLPILPIQFGYKITANHVQGGLTVVSDIILFILILCSVSLVLPISLSSVTHFSIILSPEQFSGSYSTTYQCCRLFQHIYIGQVQPIRRRTVHMMFMLWSSRVFNIMHLCCMSCHKLYEYTISTRATKKETEKKKRIRKIEESKSNSIITQIFHLMHRNDTMDFEMKFMNFTTFMDNLSLHLINGCHHENIITFLLIYFFHSFCFRGRTTISMVRV